MHICISKAARFCHTGHTKFSLFSKNLRSSVKDRRPRKLLNSFSLSTRSDSDELGERAVRNDEVSGSIPCRAPPFTNLIFAFNHREGPLRGTRSSVRSRVSFGRADLMFNVKVVKDIDLYRTVWQQANSLLKQDIQLVIYLPSDNINTNLLYSATHGRGNLINFI